MLTRRRLLRAAGWWSGGLLLSAGCGPADGPGATPAPSAARRLPEVTGVLRSSWSTDPWALGSYSFLAVGATPQDRVALAEPLGRRVWLAGEALSSDFPATVHGALGSGRDAAAAVIDDGATTAVVVGAGAAGLGAAAALSDAGVDVIVLEARERIGGRVWTTETLGVPVDLGASWIHGVEGNPLTELAEDAEVDLHPFDYDDIAEHEVGEDYEAYEQTATIEHEFAADVAELSPAALDEGEELGGGDALLPGGYGRLLEVLADGLAIELQQPVSEVAWDGPGVSLTGPGGTWEADAAIVTVPLGVLQAGTIAFQPALPQTHAAALGRLGMGVLDKLVIAFEEVFWERESALIGIVPARPGEWVAWVNLLPVSGEPALMGFNAGSVARRFAALTDEDVLASALAALAAVYS